MTTTTEKEPSATRPEPSVTQPKPSTALSSPHQTARQRHAASLQTHNFTITISVNTQNARRFIHHLNQYELMDKASLTAIPQGICIKAIASNQQLGEFILNGVQQHPAVTHLKIAAH